MYKIDDKKVKFKRYFDPKAIIKKYFNITSKSQKVLDNFSTIWVTDKNERLHVTFQDVLDGILKEGMWGFCDPQDGIIYYWHDGDRSHLELALLFGHELGHIVSKKKGFSPKEEGVCDIYGIISAIVYHKISKEKDVLYE